MHLSLALIALVLGFKVFIDASKEKKEYRQWGRAIGLYVMLLAFGMSFIWLAKYSAACKAGTYGKCPISAFSMNK